MRGYKPQRLLTPQEVRQLARKIRKGLRGKSAAREQLITHNLPLVTSIARKYLGHGIELDDLVQEGICGLVMAVDRFKPGRRCRFSTYATWWIRQTIRRALEAQPHPVRIPVYMCGIIKQRDEWVEAYVLRTGREPSEQEVAEALHLTPRRSRNLADALKARDAMLCPIVGDRVAGAVESLLAPPPPPNPDEHARLYRCLATLRPKHLRVLSMRYGLDGHGPRTLGEIATQLKCSREWVRQLEAAAISHLRPLLSRNGTG